MLYALLIYVIFIFILLFGIKFRPLTKEEDFFFSFNRLRGFFALEIVVGHVVRYESSLLYPIGKFMIISVAFFFFVSAYGMARSYDAKEDYLHGFLFSKFSYLLTIAVIAYLHSLIIYFLFTGSIEPKHINSKRIFYFNELVHLGTPIFLSAVFPDLPLYSQISRFYHWSPNLSFRHGRFCYRTASVLLLQRYGLSCRPALL